MSDNDCRACLLIMSDIHIDRLKHFRDWHNLEHLPERIAIPGFRKARRFVAIDRPDHFLALYEVENLSTLESASYRAALDAMTPDTVEALSEDALNVVRLLCRRSTPLDRGGGGFLAVWDLRDDDLASPRSFPPALDTDAIAAVHVLTVDEDATCRSSAAVSILQPGEAKPRGMLLMEGWSSAKELVEQGSAIVADLYPASPGEPRLYRFESGLNKSGQRQGCHGPVAANGAAP